MSRLDAIIESANSAFHRDWILQGLSLEQADTPLQPEAYLGVCIAQKIQDLYDEDSSDEQNLLRITAGLESLLLDLAGLVQGLKRDVGQGAGRGG